VEAELRELEPDVPASTELARREPVNPPVSLRQPDQPSFAVRLRSAALAGLTVLVAAARRALRHRG
jgi:hypothetical protein